MKYLVIGLGNLGRSIAENLARIGNEVIGIDIDLHRVDAVKQSISGAIVLDSTDREALSTLPLSEIDATIVTYGKDFGVSVQTVSLLRTFETGKIIVRSISPIHETVLRAIGIEDIITPEQDFAIHYSSKDLLGNLFKYVYKVTETHHVYKITTPSSLVGQSIGTVDFRKNFGVRLVAIERAEEVRNLIGLKQTRYSVVEEMTDETVLKENDLLILFGRVEVVYKLAEI